MFATDDANGHTCACNRLTHSPLSSLIASHSFIPGLKPSFSTGPTPRIPGLFTDTPEHVGGSVAEWLACWTQAQKARVQIAVATLSGNSLRQTAHTHRASVYQAAKLVAALLRVARITAGPAASNGSLPSGL